MNRYKELIKIVNEIQPRHIIEIGTWNGKRACQMMAVSNSYYTGFDLFEEATAETDKKEFNVKNHNDIVGVSKMIEMAGFSKFSLIRGDTKETLPKHFEEGCEAFDFCFIDGGHSVETIKSDYGHILKNIEPHGTIILDDYYDPEVVGMGCNFMAGDGEILEDKDPVAGGGHVSLVRVNIFATP